jgi:transposase
MSCSNTEAGDIVVMDNLAFHSAAEIEAAGATLLYLPPCSPDLNPIDLACSKLKAHLRQVAEHTIPRPLRRIGQLLRPSVVENARIIYATRAMLNHDRRL